MNHESWHIYSSLLNSTRSTIHQEIYWMYCRSLLKGIAPQMNPHQQLVKQFIMIRNRLDAIADGDQHQEPLQAAGTGFAWTGRGEIGWRFLQCGWNQRSVYRSLPGLLMGFVLTGSQRGCSDSANCCARRRQHVFRQPKAASSIMQCYRRVWRVMSCYMYIYIYIFEFVFVCLMWCHFSLGWHLGTSFVCWGTALADGKDRANSFLAQAELQKYTLGSLGMLVEVLMES